MKIKAVASKPEDLQSQETSKMNWNHGMFCVHPASEVILFKFEAESP